MPKTLGLEVRLVTPKAIPIKAEVVAIVRVMGRPMLRPISWIPTRSRGIQPISLKGINQGHLIIISLGLISLS